MPNDSGSLSAPRGTYDVLPPDSWHWQWAIRRALDSFAAAGYAPVETPLFEHTELFERGVGATSEVVGKQMYTFEDRAGRSLTLRPEGTAPVMRAVLEHNLHHGPLPVKVAYAGPFFRQERPQKGRYRQFVQVGIEAIGSDAPVVDAEVIEICARYIDGAGAQTTLLLNSIGHPAESCRAGYVTVLRTWLEERRDELAPEDRERIATNPLRSFDSKEPQTMQALRDAPLIPAYLCSDCAAHFEAVRRALDGVGVVYEIEPRLVRGLDYYTRTTFEFVASNLGSQNTVAGGGRYDGLAEALGGERLPGIGFALGVDRLLLARSDQQDLTPGADIYVVGLGDDGQRRAFELATRLRRAGLAAEFDLAGRSLKGQMKDAARSGARWAVILGERELAGGTAALKNLATGEQTEVGMDEIERSVGA